jgi:hypothetical protein
LQQASNRPYTYRLGCLDGTLTVGLRASWLCTQALTELIRTLVSESKVTRVIVTSSRCNLAGVDLASEVVLEPLGDKQAFALLEKHHSALDRTDEHLPALLRICQGNALMVELVAGLLNAHCSMQVRDVLCLSNSV